MNSDKPMPGTEPLPEGVVPLVPMRSVLLPARNEKDLRDVPESTRAALAFVWLRTIDDAVRAALGEGGALAPRAEFELV